MSISRNRLAIVLVILISMVGVFSFKKTIQVAPVQVNKLKVTTSFYPLAFLTERIGGQYVTVTNLTPAGAEPHDFEPSTRDITELENQDIIFLNGGGVEGYTDNLRKNVNPKKTLLIIVGKSLMSDPKDPHIWLDPILYMKEAEVVAKALIQKDQLHTKKYTENLHMLINELSQLDSDFQKGLNNCSQKNIITSHKAFSYLAHRYNLREVALAGLSPEEEPSSKTLSDITTFAKNNNIRYIFFEELVSPVIAETIAREIGAKTLVFNPLEGLTKNDEITKKTYVTIQKENLANLQIALNCK
ncbi:MAG: zinc ABC transporter substrate-binding protein [Candidatus Roizmanbacteria bacterium]|nr:zinc ABC transporter substrate-binding protein [Candidatus Roizmanbacteria bacterium]